MKVRELIKELLDVDPNLEVIFEYWEFLGDSITTIPIKNIVVGVAPVNGVLELDYEEMEE